MCGVLFERNGPKVFLNITIIQYAITIAVPDVLLCELVVRARALYKNGFYTIKITSFKSFWQYLFSK